MVLLKLQWEALESLKVNDNSQEEDCTTIEHLTMEIADVVEKQKKLLKIKGIKQNKRFL